MRRLSLLLPCLLLVAACTASMKLSTESPEGVDFAALERFAWLDSDISYVGEGSPQFISQLDAEIRGTVTSRLLAKGYVEAPVEQADFLVSYHVIVTRTEEPPLSRRYRVFDNMDSAGKDGFVIYREEPRSPPMTREGTLVVFFMDKDNQRLIWQGMAEDAIGMPVTGLGKISPALRRLLADFPSR